ncbi:MAG: hypothetical protein QGF87_05090 [Woeseiaceae bacterium]|nr:hypothetical protein [Woeseiaceae bacterium]
MTRLAIHLNDAGITLSDGERIAYREPGFAWLGDDNLTTGNEAFTHSRIDPRRIQHRFWSIFRFKSSSNFTLATYQEFCKVSLNFTSFLTF